MPVIDHAVHEKVRSTGAEPYGCANHTRVGEYPAPNRFYNIWGTVFVEEVIMIKNNMSQECRYDKSLEDQRCDECVHLGSGESYAEMVRSQGT